MALHNPKMNESQHSANLDADKNSGNGPAKKLAIANNSAGSMKPHTPPPKQKPSGGTPTLGKAF